MMTNAARKIKSFQERNSFRKKELKATIVPICKTKLALEKWSDNYRSTKHKGFHYGYRTNRVSPVQLCLCLEPPVSGDEMVKRGLEDECFRLAKYLKIRWRGYD